MVLAGIQKMTDLISQYFPNVTVYPTLGNHDNYLADQLAPPPQGSAWLQKVAAIWEHWLPTDTLTTFTYGGYYTVRIKKLLFLSFSN
jgi:sphingomyelin phosphodiesterase acid-like 3